MSLSFRSLALASFSLVACVSADPRAHDKCETLVSSYCERVASCAAQAGILGGSYSADDLLDDREASFGADAQCDDAVQVSSNFDACVRDASTQSCGAVNDALLASEPTPLPARCNEVILHVE